jgi:hypothetical protein
VGRWAVLQPFEPLGLVAFEPLVIRLPAHAVVAEARRDVAAGSLDVTQGGELVISSIARSLEALMRTVLMS